MRREHDLFIDTSGWACHLVAIEPQHSRVEDILREATKQQRKLVTTNYIIHELVALLTSTHFKLPRPKVITAINGIKRDRSVEILRISQEIDEKAWELLEARPDKIYSLVDASSISIMKDLGIREALSTDKCFSQEGLIKLL